jgi:hypothetical protein
MFTRSKSAGIVLLGFVVTLLVVAALSHLAFYAVGQTLQMQQQIIRQQQIECLGQSLAAVVEQRPWPTVSTKWTLPEVILQPGQVPVQPLLNITLRPTVPLKSLEIQVQGEELDWRLQKLVVEPPGGAAHSIYQTGIFASHGGSSATAQVEISTGGKPLPAVDSTGYSMYKRAFLPSMKDLHDYGLQEQLYATMTTRSVYKISANARIDGNGILYNDKSIIVGRRSRATGKLWLITLEDITVEDGVQLANVLLFARGNIKLGANVRLRGAIVGRTVTIGRGFRFESAPAVTQAFDTNLARK